MYLGNPVIVSLSSLFGRVTIKGCDAQDWDLRHSSPLFLESVLSLISGLNDVCMHVGYLLVVFVFSKKKRVVENIYYSLTVVPLLQLITGHSSEFVGMV